MIRAYSSVWSSASRIGLKCACFLCVQPNFGDFLRKKFSNNSNSNKPQRPNRQQQRPQRGGAGPHAGKPPHGPAGTSTGTGGTGALGGSTNSTSLGSSNLKPQRPLGDSGIGPSGAGRGFGSSGSKPPGAAGYSSSSSPPTMGTSSSGASASARASTPTGWASTSSSSGSERGPSPFQQQRLGSGSNSSPGADSKGGRAGSGSGRAGGAQPRITSGSSAGAAPGGAAPGCPLRKWLGPMAGLVFNQYDKFICPPAIVAARAALAKTAAVQSLRPQALPVKLVAVAAVVAGINLPCGAVREHFEKFSVGWFVAVHATIPFVAMLRKAVIMPKYAMLVTIAAAVMGQIVGSRIERMRLLHEQQHGPLLPLQLTLPLQQQQEETASLQGSSSARNTSSSSTGATWRGEQGGSTAQHGSGRGRNWREQLAADPEPVDQAAAGGRCGGVMGSLFARLPMVKA